MRRLVFLALLAGCGGGPEKPPPDAKVELPAVAPVTATPRPRTPDFPAGTRSLRLTRTIAVRLAPGDDAKQIGTIAEDTRVTWDKTAKATGCKKAWVEIDPRGWVCGEYLEANKRGPIGVELPRLDRGALVPGTYGKVVDEGAEIFGLPVPGKKGAKKPPPPPPPPPAPDAGVPSDEPVTDPGDAPTVKVPDPMVAIRPILGSMNVRKYGEVSYGDVSYWKVGRDNEYVPAKSIHEHTPSTYGGVRLGDDTGMTLPIAFVWPKGQATQIWVRKNWKGQGALRQLNVRDAVPILETHDENGKPTAYRISDTEWVMAEQVRVVAAAASPPLIGPHERWFDVDVDHETLVAYEGTTPIYATLVSTGKKDTPTETGIWRIWKKVTETDMSGLSGEGGDPYVVATVPWTEFFDPIKGLALHAAYWHDGFGKVHSHGCVNLSPIDARWLYFWSEPIVPPGWTMTAGVVEAPGSLVRVRSAADPAPEYKGYAKKVQDARASGDQPVPE